MGLRLKFNIVLVLVFGAGIGVSAWVSHELLRKNAKDADFSYKEATLNPTNPANRTVEWESDIVIYFRNAGGAPAGESNGFGWKHNEIIGAQVVSVPMTLPIHNADEAFKVSWARSRRSSSSPSSC